MSWNRPIAKITAVLALSLSLFTLTLVTLSKRENQRNVNTFAQEAVTDVILCDGQTYDGYINNPYEFDDTAQNNDPLIRKVIRNCIFRNSTIAAITIKTGRNILIEGNTFENIRTNEPGNGVHAINMPCRPSSNCSVSNPINDVLIQNNTFRDIGADGIQLGADERYITNVTIKNNDFSAGPDVGENSVDVKGVNGPIYIQNNTIHSFYPCESPKRGGNQDCSGSPGSGMVVHDGSNSGRANNVIIENNEFYDNHPDALTVATSDNIIIRNNFIHDNELLGLDVAGSADTVSIFDNIFSNNPTHVSVEATNCTYGLNTFDGNRSTGLF